MKMIGKIIDDKYEILEQIGQGGMAKVYRARDMRLDRFVAVKVLKPEFTDNDQFLKKFLREAQADAKLAHPNIVNVYDVGECDGIYYIVMEYVDGSTLKNYIVSNRRVAPGECVEMINAIAGGLQHAHNNGIIHRDIKPHNILLTTSKVPKVADFGIARAITSSTITATEDALGSVHYIAPEQARGGFLDERSDLYSLGIMMYEMLTGELPYDGETPVAVALKHVQNSVMSPRDLDKRIPEGVNQVVLNLTRRRPEDRYQNAKELLDDLKVLREDINAPIKPTYKDKKKASGKSVNNSSTLKHKLFGSKKRRLIFISVCALILIGIICAVMFIPRQTTIVPNVVNMTEDEAKEAFNNAHLKYEISKYQSSADVEENKVISQSPKEGTEVERRTVIRLVMSSGPKIVTIPDVSNLYQKEATDKLTSLGLLVKEVKYQTSADVKKDMVIAVSPTSGIQVKEGSEVILYVSSGKDAVSTPNLLGMSLAAAKQTISDNGLILGEVRYSSSTSYDEGQVMQQSPNAYTEADKNTRVDLVVSLGREITTTLSYDLKNLSGLPSGDLSVRIDLGDSSNNFSTVYTGTNTRTDIISVQVTGMGTRTYRVYVNDVIKYTGTITF